MKPLGSNIIVKKITSMADYGWEVEDVGISVKTVKKGDKVIFKEDDLIKVGSIEVVREEDIICKK